MTDLAFLNVPLFCPSCQVQVADQVWFQWGFCRGRAPYAESSYAVGEKIRWHSCPSGESPAWTSFGRGGQAGGSNLGDPKFKDLLVRDWVQSWLREPCPHCGAMLDGAIVEIRAGVIARGFLACPGELDPAITQLITPLGIEPEPAWDNHPLDRCEDC